MYFATPTNHYPGTPPPPLPKVIMPQWFCIKANRTIHLGAKISRFATIIFKIMRFCYIEKKRKELKTPKKMMTIYINDTTWNAFKGDM